MRGIERARVALVAGAGAFVAFRALRLPWWAEAAALPEVTVYKDATCGCCKEWVSHLRRHGFPVKSVDVPDLQAIKAQHGVPANLQSCHTALVTGYVVEGHVPADLVGRLLRERPRVLGLAVRGMPAGSPRARRPLPGPHVRPERAHGGIRGPLRLQDGRILTPGRS